MSRPYRKVLTQYSRFRRPFVRLFGYTLTTDTGRLRVSSGDRFILQSNGEPLYQSI